MNITALRYAVEVDRLRSITKAAQSLFMAQPNLSRAVKELEDELGIKIFTRLSKGVSTTPEGEQFLNYARSILSQLDELETLYKSPGADSLILHVAVPRATYASTVFADFANTYAAREHLEMSIRETNETQAIRLLGERRIQLAIVRYQCSMEAYIQGLLEANQLTAEPLWTFTMQLMFSRTHPLAALQTVPYHMLAGYTELVHGDYQLPSVQLSALRPGTQNNTPVKRILVYDRGSQYDLLERASGTYMWVSPVPADELHRHGLVLRPCLLDGVMYKDVILAPRTLPLSGAARAFADMLKAEVTRLQQDA